MNNRLTFTSGNKICINSNHFGWAETIDVFKRIYQINVLDQKSNVVIDLSNVRMLYPNGLVPLISELDRLRMRGVKFDVIPPINDEARGYAERLCWLHYMAPEKYSLVEKDRYQNFSLHSFRDVDSLNECVNGAIEVCLKQLDFAKGVPQAFEWALNELAGNILVHSNAKVGWLQVQVNRTRHQLFIALCDSGVGIPQRMKGAFPDITQDKIALERAIEKGVTSNPEHGQGNGLAGAVAIAHASKSKLAISSGRARLEVNLGNIKSMNYFPPVYGTFVEMEFNTQQAIDLPKTLWGHSPIDYLETKYENDDGELSFRLKDHARTFGNRPTGDRLRTLVRNLLTQCPGKTIAVEMEGVEVIASSFADELFGKLAVEMGIIDFSRYIKLNNVSPLCKSIIDVAIQQRMVQNYGVQNITLIKDFSK